MQSKAITPQEYIDSLPDDRQDVLEAMRKEIREHLPKGFSEEMSYGMIGYVVPHSIYPSGYHCDPKLPLPFISIASQKSHIALYHMGIYADNELLEWFKTEFAKVSSKKLDMGKSCIRFKKAEDVPIKLIGELTSKMTVQEWIDRYESVFKKK